MSSTPPTCRPPGARRASPGGGRSATLVARLKATGAFVIGKAVTSQYALFVAGPTANPRDLARTPGGSSSGSAAAVAAGFAPVALGTQTNGSIVRPASYCGIVGFKPSFGRLPRTGVLRHCALVDHPGVFARDVEDAALIVDALAGADGEDPDCRDADGSLLAAARDETPPRLAWVADPYAERAEPAARAALETFAAKLPIERIELESEFAEADSIMRVLMSAGFAQSLGAEIDAEGEAAAEVLRATLSYARGLTATDFVGALVKRDRLRALALARRQPFDAVLTFAATGEAPLRAEGTGDPIFATLWSRRAGLQPAAAYRPERPADWRAGHRRTRRGRPADARRSLVVSSFRLREHRPMIRLLVLNPNTTQAVTDLMMRSAVAVASPGVELCAVTAPRGVPYISNRSEALIGGMVALETLAEAAPAPDAAILAAFGDPGLFALREAFDFPVIGVSEAAMLAACMLGGKFLIVSFTSAMLGWYRDCVVAHGLEARCAGVVALDLPFGALDSVQAAQGDALIEFARTEARARDAACVIFGGAPLAGLAARARERMERPVIDPVAAAVKLAEALAALRPMKAKGGSFARPAAKESIGLSAALANHLRRSNAG